MALHHVRDRLDPQDNYYHEESTITLFQPHLAHEIPQLEVAYFAHFKCFPSYPDELPRQLGRRKKNFRGLGDCLYRLFLKQWQISVIRDRTG
jgi:hypothetical protein